MRKHITFFKRKSNDFLALLSSIRNLIVFLLTPTRIKRLSYDNEKLTKQLFQAKVEISRTIKELDETLIRNENIPWRLRNQLESLREFYKIAKDK